MKNKLKLLEVFENQTWITKSSDKVLIKDLPLNHLKNIVNNLKKRFDSMENPLNDYPEFGGEMAQMYAQQNWENYMREYKKLEKTLNLFECYYKIKNL